MDNENLELCVPDFRISSLPVLYLCDSKLQGAPTEQLECLTKIRNTATAIKYTIHISQPADKIMYEIETENPVTGNKRRRRLLQSGNGGGC